MIPRPAGHGAGPFFTVVVTTYNRDGIVQRCVNSCLAQTFGDLELIVVDDASTDGTVAAMEQLADPRMKVITHATNRGISTSRHTGVTYAAGEWIVVVDSDWELLPNSLSRLREIVDGLSPDIRVVRSRLQWDSGKLTPSFMPPEPIGYRGRIEWVEAEGGWDAGRCIRRDALENTPYIVDRRGAMETLWELDLAKCETTLCVDEVLGREHSDAPNSWLRSTNAQELIPRLFREAPDMLWMAQTTLERHGPALRLYGPRQYATMLRVAATQAFLLGRRRQGARYSLRLLRRRPFDPIAWGTLALGLLGGRAVAHGIVGFRHLSASAT